MKKLFLPIILLFLLVSSVAFADFVQPGIGWLVEAPNVLMPSGTTDVCQSDGVTCSTIGAASGATTALDNLASVAINTSLLSDTADTDSLGSTSKEWLNAYIGDAGKLYFGLGQDASIERSAANEMTITATAGVTVESVKIDGGVVTGASSITSTGFTGDLTGNADTVTSFTPASGSLTLSGADALTITTTGETNSTLPLGTKTLVATDVATLSSLTSIGTIGTGTWEATDVGVAHGGTGKSSWTQWLIPYADTTTSFSQIAIGTDGQVLTSAGAGVAPAFETLSIGVANLADGTDGELITWDASGVAATIGVGTADQVLTSNGAGAAPTFQDAAGGAEYTSSSFTLGETFTTGRAGYLGLYSFEEVGINNGTYIGQDATNGVKAGETFVPAMDISISGITIYCRKYGSPTDNVYIKIYESDKSTLLATSNAKTGASIAATNGDIAFTFSSNVELDGGTTYFYEVSRSGGIDAVNHYYILYSNSSTGNLGGTFWNYISSTWTDQSTKVLYSKFTIDDIDQVVFLTDADGSGDELLPIGYATAAGSAGDSVAFATSGITTISPTDSPSVNDTMYLSNTAGEVQASAGSTSVKVGRMTSATEMLIVPPPL